MEIAGYVRTALKGDAILGEGPVWDEARQVLWFVDIKRHLLCNFDPATGASSGVRAPGQIGWVLPAENRRLLCGLQDGLYFFDPQEKTFSRQSEVPGEPANNRLNDACTDRAGRAWFGSMDDAEEADSGRFYVFERGAVRPAGPADISITNGPAVSPDGERIYFTDTLGRRIMVAELSSDGTPGPTRIFAEISIPGAYPDGPVVDSEGYVWTGLWNGWSVARYSPEGNLVGQVMLPVANCTKLAFGGADLRTAFVTTARKGLDEAVLAQQPLAGSLFAFESAVPGFPQAEVKLT